MRECSKKGKQVETERKRGQERVGIEIERIAKRLIDKEDKDV